MSFNPNDYLIKLKGKDYLEVKWRLVWFRDENNPKDGTSITLSTEIVQDDGEQGLVKAIAYDGNGRVLATGHKREHKREFHDYIEKAETGAMGRVLAVLGYGTQFAEELELPEGKLVDTPVQFPSRANAGSSGAKTSTPAAPATNAREVAKQKAEAAKAAREAAANTAPPVSTPSTDDLPFDEQEVPATPAPSSAPAEATVEPINENQMKAIGNMVKMLVKKKGINEAEFIAGVCGRFGKATLAELSFEQGKEVVTQINAEMRAK